MEHYYLSAALSVTRTDNPNPQQAFCIFVGKRAFHGSERIAQLLQIVERESSLSGITASLTALNPAQQFSEADVRQVLEQQLLASGLISTTPEQKTEEATKHTYLFLSRTLLSANLVDRISRPFALLFAPAVALVLLTAGIILLGLWFAQLLHLQISFGSVLQGFAMRMDEAVLFYALLFACFLLHEIGHAAASQRFGSKPAEIGVGLYLIFPVLFCNVTEAWRLPRMARVVVNLGGVYFQLLATAALVPFQLASENGLLSLLIAANLMSILINLNPFFRFDGYWIYSDFFHLPNLRERSRELILATLSRVLQPAPQAPAASTRALSLYAVGSTLFFSFFTLTVFSAVWKSVQELPLVLQMAARKYSLQPDWESIAMITGSGLMYLVYALACLFTIFYIISTLIRGALSLWRLRPQ